MWREIWEPIFILGDISILQTNYSWTKISEGDMLNRDETGTNGFLYTFSIWKEEKMIETGK